MDVTADPHHDLACDVRQHIGWVGNPIVEQADSADRKDKRFSIFGV